MNHRFFQPMIALILFGSAASTGQDAAEDELKQLLAAAQDLPKETKAGQIVADREMARAMIEYGRRAKNPEVILLAAEILHKNPVTAVKGESETKDSLKKLIEEAVAMRPEDEPLKERAEIASETLDEASRGLAGGPRSWVVSLTKGEHYQLDPRLVYNAHEKAIITAFSEDATVMLGASVRRGDQSKELTRGVGRGTVSVQWNAGITTTGWDVRVYNLSGAGKINVKVETN